MRKAIIIAPLLVLIVILAVLPSFLPSAIAVKGVKATPNVVVYRTTNPGFENGIEGWEVKVNEGDVLERTEEAYLGSFSVHFAVRNGSSLELAEPTEYLPLNDTLCLTVAAKDLSQLANESFLEVDTLAFWSSKRIIPIHLIISPTLERNGTLTYVDDSGVYIFRRARQDGWTEYRLRLGSQALRELLVEYLRKAFNETLAHPSDEFFVRFMYIRPHNLEGYIDEAGLGYLLPGSLTLEFESRSLLPMSSFVSRVLSQGVERPFTVTGSYSFTVTYVEPVPAGRIQIEVDFSTGQRVLLNVTLSQKVVLWV